MVTNLERIARYEEMKAQGAKVADLREVCQLDQPLTIEQSRKDRSSHKYRELTIVEARTRMCADLAAGVPVNGWHI